MKSLPLYAVLLAVVLALPAFAADKTLAPPASTGAYSSKPMESTTTGTVTVEGQMIHYQAVAGTIILKNKDDKPTGSMFYVAYFKQGADPALDPLSETADYDPQSSAISSAYIAALNDYLRKDLKFSQLSSGYFDLATPFYTAVYVMHHLPMKASLQDNIQYSFYESGHMIYMHIPSLKKLHDNTTKFIESTDNVK